MYVPIHCIYTLPNSSGLGLLHINYLFAWIITTALCVDYRRLNVANHNDVFTMVHIDNSLVNIVCFMDLASG